MTFDGYKTGGADASPSSGSPGCNFHAQLDIYALF